MDAGKFNTRNPAVKRILQEIKELQRENNPDMMAEALEDNIFEWHFAIRGPPDSEFQGGIYHGRILLPPDYPFKPPSFMLLTPNGRFETGVKICLSISSHHPEHWQPSWSVRTALTALVAFLPSPGGGAIGSLEFPKEERRRLAAKSRTERPMFGSTERQAVTRSVHQRMLDAQTAEGSANQATQDPSVEPSAMKGGQTQAAESQPHASEVQAAPVTPAGLPQQDSTDLQPEQLLEEAPALPDTHRPTSLVQQTSAMQESSWEDRGLGFLAAGLTMAILAILGRRLLIIAGVDVSNFF